MPDDAPTPRRGLGRGLLWGLLWGLLVAVIAAVALLTWWTRFGPGAVPPPPVLSEIPDFTLTDREGDTVTRGDLLGAPWVADLIFTRCVLACPVMSGKMAILDRELPAGVRLVSISVDPEHDQPAVLTAYAAKFDASDRWRFLTGDRREIHQLAAEGLRLGYDPNPPLVPLQPGDDIYHSTRFVLVDGEGRVRGYYEAMEGDELDQLERDLKALD
jgi:protein SCO1